MALMEEEDALGKVCGLALTPKSESTIRKGFSPESLVSLPQKVLI